MPRSDVIGLLAACLIAGSVTTTGAQEPAQFDKQIRFSDMTAAEKTAARREAKRRKYEQLKFCADPGNMPLSSREGDGLQNRIAAAVAKQMGARVSYFWRPFLERGLTRETFDNRECDLLIEVPYGYERILTTVPIYRSTYVFATRADAGFTIEGFDDPDLRQHRLGVFQHSGMREALARHGIKDGLDIHVISQDADLEPQKQPWRQVQKVVDGQLDIAAVWGPFAGWVAKQGAPLTLTPANLMEDEVALEFDLAIGVRSNDPVLKYALDFALADAEAEIRTILGDFGVPLVACSGCIVQGDLPAHGAYAKNYLEASQKRFTEVVPEAAQHVDPARASADQLMTREKVQQALAAGADAQVELANAVLASDEDRIAFLLDRGADLDRRDLQGAPALITAAKGRDTRLLAYLLDRGADLAVTDLGGWNALHHAILRNHLPSVQLLAERGADLSGKTPGDLTPLGLALSEGMRWATKALIDAGAPADEPFAKDRVTPLMVLATQDEAFNRDARVAGGPSVLELAEALVRQGAKLDTRSTHGVTALMIAAGHDNAAMVGFLLKAGADPTLIDAAGRTALEIAQAGQNDGAIKALRLAAATVH